MKGLGVLCWGGLAGLALGVCAAQDRPFGFPTANRALLESGGGPRFFVGTAGKPWTSGMYGYVRSEGLQFHEGIDIRYLERDSKGEPKDPIRAVADGVVVYVNAKPSLSNYGCYLILAHRVEGIEIYSLYAHLREVRPGLRPGAAVRAGETVGVMGRTANTRSVISKERAHLHLELCLRLTDQYAAWHRQRDPGQRNDHGDWNGQSLIGIDPAAVYRAQAAQGAGFSLLRLIQAQTEVCRVLVRGRDLGWARRYPQLVAANPAATREGVAGYELVLNPHGLPYRVIPRSAGELRGRGVMSVVSVVEAEASRPGWRKLVVRRGGVWQVSAAGERFFDLLRFKSP